MGHNRKNPFLGLILGLAQEHSGSDDSLYLVKQIPSNGPRARFHGAPFEIVKSTKLAISMRQKQKDKTASSSSLSIKVGQLSELDKVYMQLQ